MQPKINTLTPYDVLGYLVPGGSFIMLIHVAFLIHSKDSVGYYDTVQKLGQINTAALIPLTFLAYLAGHILSLCSSLTLQRYAVWSYGVASQALLGYPSPGFFRPATINPNLSKFLRFFVAICILPISACDFILGFVLKMRANYLGEKFAGPMQDLMKKRILSVLRSDFEFDSKEFPDPRNCDFLRLMAHYLVEKAPNHVNSLRNYVVLFGFLRTSAIVCVMFFWLSGWHMVYYSAGRSAATASTLISAVLSVILYLGFVKLWFRHDEECLMAMVAIQTNQEKPSEASSTKENDYSDNTNCKNELCVKSCPHCFRGYKVT